MRIRGWDIQFKRWALVITRQPSVWMNQYGVDGKPIEYPSPYYSTEDIKRWQASFDLPKGREEPER